jgi:hypothetical protein
MSLTSRSYEPPSDTIINVMPDGTAPKKRVSSVDAAREIYDDCVLDQEPIARSRARIRGLVDGNPPYDPQELRRMGQGWRTNFNAREAEAIIDSNSSALWEMQHDTFVAARFSAIDPSYAYSPENGMDYGDIIGQEYTHVLKNWDNWPLYTDLVIHDSMESGMGAMIWADPTSILPKWYNISNFTFPKKATCSIGDLDFFFLRDEIPLHRLFRVIESKEAAKEEGWNVDGVREYIVQTYGFGSNPGSSSPTDEFRMSGWEALQQMIKNNDSWIQRNQFEGVKVVHMFVREVDAIGGITHLIFTEDDVVSAAVDKKFQEDKNDAWTFRSNFLFEKQREYAGMSNVLWWLLYSYGDGFLNSVKGLGHRITPHCEASNRLICATFDSGILSSSLLMKPLTAVDFSKLSILRVGPFTYIPENMEAVQTSYNPKIDGLVLLRDMSSSILNNNTGVYRVRNENPLKSEGQKTAREVMSEESKEARFEKSQAAYFYAQWDFFHREIFRRLCSSESVSLIADEIERQVAMDFRGRCGIRGVPFEVLDPILWDVRAERAIGLGSAGMRLDVTSQLLGIRGMMPEENQVHAAREFIAARVGAQHVDRFIPLKPKSMFASDAASIATLENNDFNEGSWVPVGSDQPHGIHIPVHMTPVLQIVEAFTNAPEQIDAREVYKVLTVAVPHIQQHLAYMANDHVPEDSARREKFNEYSQMLGQVNEFMGRLEGVIKKIEQAARKQEEQEQQQLQELQAMAEQQQYEVQKYKIDKEAELKRYEADLLHQSRMAKTNTSIEASVRRVLSDLQNKQALTQAEIATKYQKAAADAARRPAPTGE